MLNLHQRILKPQIKMETTINLENFLTKGSKVFTGRERGAEVRKESKIDELATKYDKITVVIPENVRAISYSFLENFLLNVVRELGERKFYSKFQFICNGEYEIQSDLYEAVENILKEDNALA